MSELLTKPSPKPRDFRPEISLSADLICRKMMAKTRDLRYADARVLLEDLHHAQTFGDAGLERLEAASIDGDSIAIHQREVNYGIETSTEGVYAEPEEPPQRPTSRPASTMIPPRPADNGVFGAAALLIALVTVTTLLLAWAGPNHPLSFLKNELALLSGNSIPPQAEIKPKPAEKKENAVPVKPATQMTDQTSHTAPKSNPPTSVVPTVPSETPAVPAFPLAVPVALPADGTNAVPALPLDPTNPVLPAQAALPDSAFAARDVAEKSLDPGIVAPTGHAELLMILGKRDATQVTPSTWTFYFFDKSAAGHARIITVNGGKVIKTGEDLVHFASPYTDQSVLAEDQIQKDSTDALLIAQSFIPDVTVTSSEFVLMQQKNSVPMWKVTLWVKNASGEEHKLGDITLLAENGTLIRKELNP